MTIAQARTMTTNLYAPPSQFRGERVVLPEGEAHHARSVLRVQKGDEIVVVDGEGGWYRVQIDHQSPQQVVGTVLERQQEVGEPGVALTVGVGLLTKRSRFETFVEKAVELGVTRIVPLSTRHTETEEIRSDRLRRVMIAALKQCRRSCLPVLTAPQSLEALLRTTTASTRLICHGGAETTPLLQALDGSDGEVLALVGPEGGFSTSEMDAAIDAGCVPVSLGPRRLRAETAGIVAVNAVMLHHQRRPGHQRRPAS